MTGKRSACRGGAADQGHAAGPPGQASDVLRLFEGKAAGWVPEYAPDGPLAGRLASLSASRR